MKRLTWVLLGVATIIISWMLVGTSTAEASIIVSDDFESYTFNAWPSANWVANANAVDQPSLNQIVADPTDSSNQVLKLFGQTSGSWAALAFTPATFPADFTVQALIRNGNEQTNGVQPFRGSLGLRYGTDWPAWTNPARRLLQFTQDGNIVGAESNNTVLQSYNSDQWYNIKVNYHRDGTTLTLHYWIDDVDRGSEQIQILDLSDEQSFDHVEFAACQGSVYFDNLFVFSDNLSGSPVPIPGAVWLLGSGLVGLVGLRRKIRG